MYIKRYTIAAFILIALVGWYIYAYVSQGSTSLDFFGIPMPSLKIALWVIIPLVILYLASVAHMTFYSILGNFRLRKYEKDYEKILNAIMDMYLGKKDRNYTFKTPRYKLLGTLLENSVVFPKDHISGKIEDERIDSVLKAIESIKNGEVVDLKQFHLSSDNELVIQNVRNKYKKGDLKAEEVIANVNKYSKVLCQEVYTDYVKTTTLNNIEKYKEFLTKDALNVILLRINADEYTLDISNETLLSLFKKLDLNKDDYMDLAVRLSSTDMIPEQRIKLFETLSDENEEVIEAYLYALLDLEMVAPVKVVLENSQPNEYQNYKAYIALKECGKHFNIRLFI